MNRSIVIPSIFSLLALMLVGCEEDDGSYGSGGDSNKITLTNFAKSYDSQANDSAIARIDETYRDGERDIKIKNLVNNYSNQSLNTLNRMVLADNFEGNLDNKDIEVDGRTVKRPIYEKNSNNKLKYETNYKTLDLTGLQANSYRAGTNINNRRGIITDLNNYPDIPAGTAFPTGSVCYIPVVTSERSFLAFNEKNKTGYSSLGRWIKAAEERFSDNRGYRLSEFGAGIGNKQDVAQVTFFEYQNQPAYQYNGVEYTNGTDDKNAVYEANYVEKGIAEPNTDSRRGVVDCTLVNEVAGDFLAAQIQRYH
ncbi:hypothetical protein [Psychrobacter immobilis]|uniref:hypothetical protein n=1 Tax=Psychrobacter immobilis TaxID=498 RepID=UPI0019183D37|nr:hypothetical protein [Psychrobacter immobilis]